jgi:hypothetical protein
MISGRGSRAAGLMARADAGASQAGATPGVRFATQQFDEPDGLAKGQNARPAHN